MCTSIIEIARAEGMAKRGDEWFPLSQAVVAYDHARHAPLGDVITLDFINTDLDPGARAGIELTLETAKELRAALDRAIAAAEFEEAEVRGKGAVPRLSCGRRNDGCAPAEVDTGASMNRDRTHFLFLNIGHFLDHLFTLIFATVAALALTREWGLGYGELLKYATPGFFAFGVFSLSGRLARRQMEPRRHDGGVLRRHRALRRSRPALRRRRCRSASGCS